MPVNRIWKIALAGAIVMSGSLSPFQETDAQNSNNKVSEASASKAPNVKPSAGGRKGKANKSPISVTTEREPSPIECYQRYLVDLCRASEPSQIEIYLSSRLQERWQRLRTEDPATIDKEFRLYKRWMVFQPKFTQQALAAGEDNPNRERILLTITGNTVADEQGKYTNMITGTGSYRMELAKEFGFWKVDCASLTGRRIVDRNTKHWKRTPCCDVK